MGPVGKLSFGVIIAVLMSLSAPALVCAQTPASPAKATTPDQQQTAADPSTQQIFIPPTQSPSAQQPGNSTQSGQSGQSNAPNSGQANQSGQANPSNQTGQAQQPGAASTAPNASSQAGSDDRLFFALPNFGTVENPENIKPLTVKQKFDLQFRGTFDPVEFPYIGLVAAVSQATNSDPGYGQGALGYAKRYGADFLDNVDENFMVGAIYPTILREDPRYFQLGKGNFFHRLLYAASRSAVIRTDSGHETFNFSEVLGSATAAAIGTTYRVGGERTFSDAASDWGTQVGWDTLSNELKEFWPDIRRGFQHKRNSQQQTQSPQAN